MSWTNWSFSSLSQLWSYLSSGRTLAVILGAVCAIVAVALFFASRTRWGRSKPLTKCIVLSVLAHVWMIMYAFGTRDILPQGDPSGSPDSLRVSLQSSLTEQSPDTIPSDLQNAMPTELQPWESIVPAADLPAPPLVASRLEPPPEQRVIDPIEAPSLLEPVAVPAAGPIKSEPTALAAGGLNTVLTASTPEASAKGKPEASAFGSQVALDSKFTATDRLDAGRDDVKVPTFSPPVEGESFPSSGSSNSPILPPESVSPPRPDVPLEYRLRQAPNRLELAMPYGADHDSEAAVERGLLFLASAQSTDGSWNAKRFGGGTETRALGEHRHNTGDRADTGVSGLALLAFLSGGHTHLEGEYRENVRSGLEYLLRAQMPSGDLSGPKQIGYDPSAANAKMYCHGIATLAIAEAYAMTRDATLLDALNRAANFTCNAQDVRGGGWRYRAGDPGDLSQFGWQAMALRSAELSGVRISMTVKSGMHRFVDSCAAGRAGGLARYRPGEGGASVTMTAEALACRLLLSLPLSVDARQEAEQSLMQNLPGTGEENVYYWYYATLALFQMQDNNWRTWNQALKSHLLKTQQPVFAADSGSWNPDKLWGGYGGRIYSTAMSCLCLEVYYRYLPMYQRSNLAGQASPRTSR